MDLEALYALAHSRFPHVQLASAQFEAAWTARKQAREEFAPDVFLATAIEQGDADASKWLLQTVQSLGASLERKYQQRIVSDAVSHVLESLTVGRGIARYGGTGPLRGWLSVVISRQTYLQSQPLAQALAPETVEARIVDDLSRSVAGLEKGLLQRKFSGHLKIAIEKAAATLSQRERTLLSLHYLDAVSLDALASSYQVHRATVARWIAAAKESFMDGLRRVLIEEARISGGEVDSLIRLLMSQADVSMRAVLGG